MKTPEFTLFSTQPDAAGFRLQRFEVCNWGAFSGIYTLPLSGENALLCGANGAGKTTIVDAIIALLNPTSERYFNQSAGSEDRKRTRRLGDYVNGVYGHSANGREQLRNRSDQQDEYTVLLGVFFNRATQQTYTLAHLYYFRQGELQKRYYTAPVALSIEQHFTQFSSDIRAFNNYLKGWQVQAHDSFEAFALDFQAKLGMRVAERANNAAGRTKPLHLLAKTAGIKVLGNLDMFIRENMLDETNMEEKFDQLKKQYADIAETQLTLDKVTEQQKMLLPLLEKNSQYLALKTDQVLKLQQNELLGPWFAQQQVGLLEAELKRLTLALEQKREQFSTHDEQLIQLRNEEARLNAEKLNSGGNLLKDLEQKKNALRQQLEEKEKKAAQYAEIASTLGLVGEPDGTHFFAQKSQLPDLDTAFATQQKKLDGHRDELKIERHNTQQSLNDIQRELKSLQQRNNNLPADLIELRKRLCAGIDVPESELPFVGELVQVLESERAVWEYGLEKLLGPFSLQLLVPAQHLSAVVKWVRANHLNTQLRFMEADMNATLALSNDFSPNIAANKLEVQPKSPFEAWLRTELNRRFTHEATTENAVYERLKQALTPEGLIKNGKQHQKDDRKRQINFVLGWSNADKISRLQQAASERTVHLNQLHERLLPLQSQLDAVEGKRRNVARLGDFTDFKSIDFRSVGEEMEETIREIETIRQSSAVLDALEKQLVQVKSKINTETQRRDANLREQEQLKIQINTRNTSLGFQKNDAQQLQGREAALRLLIPYIEDLTALDLDSIATVKNQRETQLREQLRKLEAEISNLKFVLERAMQTFKHPVKALLDRFPSWPDDTDALGEAVIDHIGDYTALLERIQNEQLPTLRERYQARASQDIGNAMRAFQQYLKDQFEDHRQNIANINRSLKLLPYTHNTYLEVQIEDGTKKDRVGQFYKMLHGWDYDRAAFQAASESEQLDIWRDTVVRIGTFIHELANNDAWRKEITDVRNWLNFKTLQRYTDTDQPVLGSLQDSTSGKSGGEQAKLTYTVLAAALTYQFNISADHRNARSFRFIVVDEAFSKLDPENSAYLLNLLGSLHFQMLIITPNTGMDIGQERISHLIYVQKKSELPPKSSLHAFAVKDKKVHSS
jgi:uncharacterized protein YPO0396